MENITKQDLEKLKKELISEIKIILVKQPVQSENFDGSWEWLRSKTVRKILQIAPATLQNLRIRGKIRSKKIMGSYYYNSSDLRKLFEND